MQSVRGCVSSPLDVDKISVTLGGWDLKSCATHFSSSPATSLFLNLGGDLFHPEERGGVVPVPWER